MRTNLRWFIQRGILCGHQSMADDRSEYGLQIFRQHARVSLH